MEARQKILIVDDEPRNQRIVIETIEDLAEFRTAASGEEALALLEEFRPDLVLLDIMMPGIDGYEVCRKIRAMPSCALTKVILVSGKAMIEERLKGYDVGADDYMTKPFIPEELLAKAKVFLRLVRLESQLTSLNEDLDRTVQTRTRQLLETEAKLANSSRLAALGEMAGGIAHEINTPLSTICLMTEEAQTALQETPADVTAALECIQAAHETAWRISDIVQGLRTFARDGSQDPFNTVRLKSVIDGTLRLCRERLKQNGVQLDCELADENLMIECRPVQIAQVLTNLINNASDAVASLPEKWIKIGAEVASGRLVISVTDSGSGIPEDVAQKLFQPFFTTKDVGKGTGLGLSISTGIISAHGGEISLDRNYPHTRFVISLKDVNGDFTSKEAV